MGMQNFVHCSDNGISRLATPSRNDLPICSYCRSGVYVLVPRPAKLRPYCLALVEKVKSLVDINQHETNNMIRLG